MWEGAIPQKRRAIFDQLVSGVTGHLLFAYQLTGPRKYFFGTPQDSELCVSLPTPPVYERKTRHLSSFCESLMIVDSVSHEYVILYLITNVNTRQ